MTQQTQFKKLKEQIEAAKRDLAEMSDTEMDDGVTHASSFSALPEIVEPKQIKIKPDDVPSHDTINAEVVDMVSKQVSCDTPIADDKLGNSARELTNEFQFFHREKRPKSSGDLALGGSLKEALNVESEVLLFERLGHRLAILEGDVEQNREYILELINLLSKLDLRQKPLDRKLKPSQRLNRRHIFWLVIGCLALGWFGLTPSGHIAVRHFLTLI